jgi:hypothetical protein
MTEDWPILMSFFPEDWLETAATTGVLTKLRKDKDAENYLRTLLIHLACGHSMRETVVRAKIAGLADISDVALLGRLRKAQEWLRSLCISLIKEQQQGLKIDPEDTGFQMRLFDATTVKEPGKTGSLWRIHYSVQLPSLICDFFKVTPTKGKGTGESFSQYPIRKGDYILADAGYSNPSGIHHLSSKHAYVTVRVNPQNLMVLDRRGNQLRLLDAVQAIQKPGAIRSRSVMIPTRNSKDRVVNGRICAIRKTEEAIEIAHRKIKRSAQKSGQTTRPETFEYAKYVIVFTTFPRESFSDFEVLEWYRSRWQVELVFKRFKSIAHLGHLPKRNDESSKAWLYGKLFAALLTDKLITHASSVSPWGYVLEERAASERLA